jgi:membrane-associated phospholipid phosphatase
MRLSKFRMHKRNLFLLAFIVAITLLSLFMLYLNRCCYRFPGLFYFEPSLIGLNILLFGLSMGLRLQFDMAYDTLLLKGLRAVCFYILIINICLLSTTAVQYTPYIPIDKKILFLERHYLFFDLKTAMDWLGAWSYLRRIADIIYRSLVYEVIIFPLLLIYFKQYRRVYNFYFMVLLSWLIGSVIYYYFPTAAPASVMDSIYFTKDQYLTGLKFWQLHHYIQPINPEGGMISMPSFHVIWALLCLYLLRPWPVLFWICAAFNSLIILSCVLLGWHYLLDVVASALITLFVYSLLRFYDHAKFSNEF